MARALLLSVRFQEGRYHGVPDWPPSPLRLFQALVAAAARGGALPEQHRAALGWLECLDPPVISAPAVRMGSAFKNYVPNNDLDAVGRDPRRVGEIRAPKLIRPLLFDAETPLAYAWRFEEGEDQASRLCAVAGDLYQLGRGVDMAWAWGEIIEAAELEARLRECGGALYRPGGRDAGRSLNCPQEGSLDSLEHRFRMAGQRFTTIKAGKKTQHLFSQAPKPRFAPIRYDSPPLRLLFEFRAADLRTGFAAWPLTKIVSLAETIRDSAATRLEGAYGTAGREKEKALVAPVFGLRRNATDADKAARIRIATLPSIGSVHVVRSIRRVLVEVPADCPLPAEDIAWTFSGLDLNVDHLTGEVSGGDKPVLVATDERSMLSHYGVEERRSEGHRVWRTVTPAALPSHAARRRVDPRRLQQEVSALRAGAVVEFKEAKSGPERIDEQSRAAAAVASALRHAEVSVRPFAIRVQREPFEGRGARAEAFGDGTRFAKERLWHVEITFAEAVHGPLVIGDGRYLGLGLMQPVGDVWRDVIVLPVLQPVDIAVAETPALVHAVRRALMALSRDEDGRVPRLFSGHEADGERAASGRHEHVFLAADDGNGDGRIDRLIVSAPWACDHAMKADRRLRQTFDDVVSRLDTVRAGRLGLVQLGRPMELDRLDPLAGPARVWESRTYYRATRHAGRGKDPKAVLVQNVIAECARRHLPRPEVDILEFSAVPDGGRLIAHARLRFAAAVHGPLLLGRDSHKGGGLFAAKG
jgi:CRISPR-associated protein Csb2